ncbi:hypothetical protein A2Y83_01950 [Candidatus Falkowbacteria bacterium RBG_13_39_14]|uniref:Uncharacterized protein n=1 Tax=Candidatus Falkowbacteria bacterium RBG_13_39_14 TaxID=1797985 RepID=A0A1F5S0R2_9BACT|nr:MAG: hypothetical protein A2Y83_01950 [Candidatus Falkowbacteria bacterium RBG_13_39_14]
MPKLTDEQVGKLFQGFQNLLARFTDSNDSLAFATVIKNFEKSVAGKDFTEIIVKSEKQEKEIKRLRLLEGQLNLIKAIGGFGKQVKFRFMDRTYIQRRFPEKQQKIEEYLRKEENKFFEESEQAENEYVLYIKEILKLSDTTIRDASSTLLYFAGCGCHCEEYWQTEISFILENSSSIKKLILVYYVDIYKKSDDYKNFLFFLNAHNVEYIEVKIPE